MNPGMFRESFYFNFKTVDLRVPDTTPEVFLFLKSFFIMATGVYSSGDGGGVVSGQAIELCFFGGVVFDEGMGSVGIPQLRHVSIGRLGRLAQPLRQHHQVDQRLSVVGILIQGLLHRHGK